MSKYYLQILLIFSIFVACKPEKQGKEFHEKYQNIRVNYPNDEAYRDTSSLNLYGKTIKDTFRTLETASSLQTRWIKNQQSLTQNYFNNVPFRDGIKKRLEALWDYEVYSSPQKKGGFYFFYKRNSQENLEVLYRREGVDGDLELVLDPNDLTNVGYIPNSEAISGDGTYLAYQIRKSGRNINQIVIKDIETGIVLPDTVKNVKASSIAWYGRGFFYSRFAISDGVEADKFHQVYYHALGNKPEEDQFVFGDRYHADWIFELAVTEDEKYLVLKAMGNGPGNALLVRDLTAQEPDFISLVDSLNWKFEIIGNEGVELLVLTNYRAPMQRVARINPSRPELTSWREVIAEKDEQLLDEVHLLGSKLVTKYLYRAATQLSVYDLNGQLLKEIDLPKGGVVEHITGSKSSNEAFFSCSSIIQPRSIYQLDLNSFASEVYQAPKAIWDPLDLEFEQVWYSSYDKHSIPMFIFHKKGIKLDGNNLAFLFCKGGFNEKLLPKFNPTDLHLFSIILENEGICGIPYIRGGGEFGHQWHQAGLKKGKVNGFNDFLFAAQYLINQGYTSTSNLAIYGEEHGGLVVGYSIIERPDMFGVAITRKGIFDLLKFPAFSNKPDWWYEFGDPTQNRNFDYLYAYSPVYRVERADYPAVFMSAFTNEPKINPVDSYKFAATLQSNQLGINPILIRLDTLSNHQAGQEVNKKIDEAADILTFLFYNLKKEALYE